MYHNVFIEGKKVCTLFHITQVRQDINSVSFLCADIGYSASFDDCTIAEEKLINADLHERYQHKEVYLMIIPEMG